MTRRERLRRTAILCCNCTRNLAYYRSGWHHGVRQYRRSNLESTINSNFLDIAVLEWCKLFLPKEKHAWPKIVTKKDLFQLGLLARLNLDQANFELHQNELRKYRNKFVAHLDSESVMEIPLMGTVKNSVIYYYDYLRRFENQDSAFTAEFSDLAAYYRHCEAAGHQYYQNT